MFDGYVALSIPKTAPVQICDPASPFAAWNKGLRPLTRNCYAFAADAFAPDIEPYRAKGAHTVYLPGPGTTGGKPFPSVMSADILREGLVRDGFVYLQASDPALLSLPAHHVLIACFYTWRDFHFYRYFEPEGLWYSKPSCADPVTCLDFSGQPVRDILKADRGAFVCLAGFFVAPPQRRSLSILIADKRGRLLFGQPSGAKRSERVSRSNGRQSFPSRSAQPSCG